MASHHTTDGPLIGRVSELTTLASLFEMLPAGHGALVLISGETGIGKTSLALEFGKQVQAAGAIFAVGRCYQQGVAPPFSPWPDLLHGIRAVAQVECAEVPSLLPNASEGKPSYRFMQSVVDYLHRVSAAHPIVLLLDDLHWACRDSLALLDLATRNLENLPILVIATFRSDDVSRGHPLYGLLPQLRRNRRAEVIHLREFNLADTVQLVEQRLGKCSPQLADYLYGRSDGNALFLVELLRSLIEQRILLQNDKGEWLPPAQETGVPLLLQQIIHQRITHLRARAEAFLEAAAVVGQQWQLGIIEKMLGWNEEQLMRALEVSLNAQVVTMVDERTEQYRFTHGLVREVLYGGQLARRRKLMHRRVAEVLEGGGQLDPRDASSQAMLAYHFREGGVWEKAAKYGIAAGDHARERLGIRSALQFYTQARDILHRESAEVASSLRVELCERLGGVHLVLDQPEQAEAEFRQMHELARVRGDRAIEGWALSWLSRVYAWQSRMSAARSAAKSALQLAEELGDTRLLAATHESLGSVCLVTGDFAHASRHLRRAERLARESQHFDVLSWSLQKLAQLAYRDEALQKAVQLAREALSIAKECRIPLYLGGAHLVLGIAYVELGQYEQAREILQAGLDSTEEAGDGQYRAHLLHAMGRLYRELGDAREARKWDQQGLEVARRGASDRRSDAVRNFLLSLAADELQDGKLELAGEYLRLLEQGFEPESTSQFPYVDQYPLVRAELALAQGSFDEALRWIETVSKADEATTARARQIRIDVLRGRAYFGLGRFRMALGAFQRALDSAEKLEHGFLRWQSRFWLGQVCATLDARATAEHLLAQAIEQVTAIAGAFRDVSLRTAFETSPTVQELHAAMRRLQIRRNQPSTPKEPYPAGLTSREVEVLRFVAKGRTNQEIARLLSISVKTANAHVASILRKTECTNRVEAARFALRHGLA